MLEKFIAWVKEISGLDADFQSKLLISIVSVFILWLLSWLIKRIIWRNTSNAVSRYRLNKAFGYCYIILFILVLLRIWFRPSWSIVNILALVSAAMTIALQDLVKSFAGWIYILTKRPFCVGDRIQIEDIVGDVIDISAFNFTLNEIGKWVQADQSTGRVMHIPNSVVLSKPITNFTEGFPYIWTEVPVLVTFESDWKNAKKMLLKIAEKNCEKLTGHAESKLKEASKKYMIFYHKLTPIVYTSVKDSGVLLTMRLLVEPRRRRGCEEAIWEDILTEFAEHDNIDFAYPTQRFYDNLTEGKPAIKPS